ncbi:MAG: hypothetical protein Q8881_03665, partial [Sweet potato little leaf phytoplasma]|nr:hypothetical protein [Sweet potato little leaf phytoplasma]
MKYVYLGEDNTLPVIISSELSNAEKGMLLQVLQANKQAIGWTIADIKGISAAYCQHKIILEEGNRPCRQP